MSQKVLLFKSCVNEFLGLGESDPSLYPVHCIATSTAQVQSKIDSTYAGTLLDGQVTGIGYGWQKFVVPKSGKMQFVVRGAAGGSCMYKTTGCVVNPVTGVVTKPAGSYGCNRGGRGAKMSATVTLPKGAILYILVGMRGMGPPSSDTRSAGAGGASIVLIDNPLGAFTFVPLNRKVDVLIVAGGGGSGVSIRNKNDSGGDFLFGFHGKDAVLTNGVNTSGGDYSAGTWGGSSGAGLTGNGNINQKTVSAVATPAILSGNLPSFDYARCHGGWGGGGQGYCGGAGGGGYSGGQVGSYGSDKATDALNFPGMGGTSYVNPLYCTDIVRSFATVAEDSDRNLQNPWTAYGAVEITLNGREEGKFFLALDADGYKYFDGETEAVTTGFTSQWQLLANQNIPDEETFSEFGQAEITSLDGLKSPVEFLVSSKEPEELVNITGLVNKIVIKMNTDASLADVSQLLTMTANYDTSKTNIKFAISKDYGKTWQTYNSGSWVNVDISNKEDFYNQSYDINFYSAIPIDDWISYNAKTLRFAFCVEETVAGGTNSFLSQLAYKANLVGSWRHFTESQASYEYITDDTVEITFKEAGNYKVNYLDSIT